jgi:hypothetical protein
MKFIKKFNEAFINPPESDEHGNPVKKHGDWSEDEEMFLKKIGADRITRTKAYFNEVGYSVTIDKRLNFNGQENGTDVMDYMASRSDTPNENYVYNNTWEGFKNEFIEWMRNDAIGRTQNGKIGPIQHRYPPI